MAITTYPLNGIMYNAEDAEGYMCTRTSGVFSAVDQFRATVTGDMEVTISPGTAWIKNTEFSGKSIVSREPVALTVPTADGALPRMDRVVIRFDKAENASHIVIKAGTPQNPPVAPAVTQSETLYELGLYTILVPAAALEISAANVTNTMLDETVCGVMRDAVTRLPTAQMGAQWNAMINDLANALLNAQDGALITRTQYDATAESGAWLQQEDGRYINDISVVGLLETDEGSVDVDMSDATVDTAQDLTNAWSMVDKVETITGGVRLTCFVDIPEIDLPIIVEVIR